MDDVTLSRALHVGAVVLWIGGVGFVTTVVLPALRRMNGTVDPAAVFDAIERRFGWQARLWILVVGATGFHMLARLDLWPRFADPAYWWMDGMVLIWVVFTLILFVAEPLFVGRWVRAKAAVDPNRTWRLLERLHWVLFLLSLVVVVGAVAGAHGLLLFD